MHHGFWDVAMGDDGRVARRGWGLLMGGCCAPAMREVAEWRRRRGKRKAPGRLVLGGRELGSRAVEF